MNVPATTRSTGLVARNIQNPRNPSTTKRNSAKSWIGVLYLVGSVSTLAGIALMAPASVRLEPLYPSVPWGRVATFGVASVVPRLPPSSSVAAPRHRLRREGIAAAEPLRRAVQRHHARRAAERRGVREPAGGPGRHRRYVLPGREPRRRRYGASDRSTRFSVRRRRACRANALARGPATRGCTTCRPTPGLDCLLG